MCTCLAGRDAAGFAHAVAAADGPGEGVPARCGALVDVDADSEFALVRYLDGSVRGEARIGRQWPPPCGDCVTRLRSDGAEVRDVLDARD
jgi:hypothetical protein